MRLADVSPLASAFWRMALAAPLLWTWALARRRTDLAEGKPIGFMPAVAWAGLFFAGDISLWHLALHDTSVSNATLLSNFAPIFIALWMWLRFGERFAPLFLVGLVATLIGAVMLVAPNAISGEAVSATRTFGDGLGLASAVFYAAYLLAIKDARERYSTARLMAWSTTVTALVLLPIAMLGSDALLPQRASGWLPLFGLALVAQIGGQTVIAYALAHLPASLASVSLLIQPLTATVAAWLILGEKVEPIQMVGGALLVGGIAISKAAKGGRGR